jgi:hypothetical protein
MGVLLMVRWVKDKRRFKVIRTKLNGRGARASQRSEPNAKLVGLPLRPAVKAALHSAPRSTVDS